MGDGRFYTETQFINIVFITIQIILIVISMMFSAYKNNDKKNKSLLMIFIGVILIFCLRFYEAVVVSVESALFSRQLQISMFIIIQILMLNFLYQTFIYNPDKENKISTRTMKNIYLSVFICISAIVFVVSDGFIMSYSFDLIRYTNSYRQLLFVFYIGIIIAIIYLKIKLPNKYQGYDKRYLLLILILWALPIMLYIILLYMKFININFVESCMYLLMVISLNITVNYLIPYKVTLSIFNNVKDLIMDYVFIIDVDGRIVYKNKGIESIDFFKDVKNIETDNLFKMFSIPIELREAYDKKFIKITSKDIIYYYSYTIKSIENDGLEVGNIITFVDITNLIMLLDDLKTQQKNTQKINLELLAYSQNVFNLEKEKEINILLDEITKKQEVSMKQLRNDILKMIKEKDPLIDLLPTITEAKKNLSDVRAAVSTYMQYYEGDN